ncbi:fluoride efflux transporter FluC [Rickettsiales bacterium LUAb2]
MNIIILSLIVGSGSFIGGAARFLLGYIGHHWFALPVFYNIAIINIIGCFFIGILFVILNAPDTFSQTLKYFVIPGVLGGFTTFSAFSLDFILLMLDKKILLSFLYLFISISFSIIGTFLGLRLGNLFSH